MERENFLGREMGMVVLRLRVLYRIKREKMYTYALLKEFDKIPFFKLLGKDIKNDVYNTINSLKQGGYVRVSTKLEDGRMKKYYTITKKGDNVLKSALKVREETAKELSKLFD
ncbi:MAG: helix-turn-helix transcriptional regulator [Candidatus Micrarchaeales archaeon]|nr:helix-turn-helix transcriptional regulator [Candidatus Micrarchaeales archaeon]